MTFIISSLIVLISSSSLICRMSSLSRVQITSLGCSGGPGLAGEAVEAGDAGGDGDAGEAGISTSIFLGLCGMMFSGALTGVEGGDTALGCWAGVLGGVFSG